MIEDVTDQHAVILNRVREASMLMPGQTLLVTEVTPALFAAAAANAAERAAPGLTLVSVSMIGAAGRVYMAGALNDIERGARGVIERARRDPRTGALTRWPAAARTRRSRSRATRFAASGWATRAPSPC